MKGGEHHAYHLLSHADAIHNRVFKSGLDWEGTFSAVEAEVIPRDDHTRIKQDFHHQRMQLCIHTLSARTYTEYILCAKSHEDAGDKVNQMEVPCLSWTSGLSWGDKM